MVTVQTRFSGVIRPMVRREREEFTLPDEATYRDLVQAWVAQYGPNLARLLLTSEGELRGFAKMYCDGEEIRGESVDLPIARTGAITEVRVVVFAASAGG